MGWILLIVVFNLNGQYEVRHLDFDTKDQCQELNVALSDLRPPSDAQFHHLISMCVKGQNRQELHNVIP